MRWRGSGAATAVFAACALVAQGMSLPTSPAEAAGRSMPKICTNELASAKLFGADTSRLGVDGVLTLDGRSVTVVGNGAAWGQSDDTDGTWTARFHGMAWLVQAASEGFPAVDLLLARDAALPDPGSSASIATLRSSGWTEGAVRLREGTVNCLWAATHDERLVPVMEALVVANLDPYRYRGRPLKRVQNHGTMSNVVLLESARLFNRPDWRDEAFARLTADARYVFSACGMTAEQSTSYHRVNVNLWRQALAKIAAEAGTVPEGMVERLDAARVALVQLTRPDGILEAIGDSNEERISAADFGVDTSVSPTRLWCHNRGWAANRSSWDDSLVHYTVRFGPHRGLHGHNDQGSLTWFAHGVPVFSDRGLYDKARTARYQQALSMASHSTFQAVGFAPPTETQARYSRVGSMDEYVLRWSQGPTSGYRMVQFPLDQTYLRVIDEGLAPWDQQWMQNWQLNPQWQVLPRQDAGHPAAVHPSGLYLYGACWSGMYMRGSAQPVEAFPAWRTAVPAVAFRCGGMSKDVRIDTLWVVSDILGTLTWDRSAGTFVVTPDVATTAQLAR